MDLMRILKMGGSIMVVSTSPKLKTRQKSISSVVLKGAKTS